MFSVRCSMFDVRFLFVTVATALACAAAPAGAGTIVIPAAAFARGNVRVHEDPKPYADAGPVVAGGKRKPWGYAVEYDVDIPVTGTYSLQICYASAEARPVCVYLNGVNLGNACGDVTFPPASGGDADTPSWKSSGAKWEMMTQWEKPMRIWRRSPLARGKYKLKITRQGPLPHLVALRLHTPKDFPKDWQPPRYKGLDRLKITAQPVTEFPALKPGSRSLRIPAWTFDRGNAPICADPSRGADVGPFAGGEPVETSVEGPHAEIGFAEYDIDFPVTAEYTLQVRYASAEARPTGVWLGGRRVGTICNGITFGSATDVKPVQLSGSTRWAKWEGLYDGGKGTFRRIKVSKGKHTVKLSRHGPLPHLTELCFTASAGFPKGWKRPARKANLGRVPPRFHRVFLPPGAVVAAALRQAVQDRVRKYGPGYPEGPRLLKRMAELETGAGEASPEQAQARHDAWIALRRDVMLSHPALKFDKLLFLKRSSGGYGHTYSDQHGESTGGNLCVLSPVTPDGKVTELVPELNGGLFDRFDLSYDAKRVVFAYKTKGKGFRIYEIGIDPAAGTMVPGSLRQLTFDAEGERGRHRRFEDMDPCYLPNGKILFVSTRAQRIVYCAPGASVTTLYLMDADGANLHRVSESPLNEATPSMLEDGRVVYRRWEYVDKGLGNAQSLWSVRPDGSGVDHVYKNNTPWPAGMSSPRSVPGSRRVVAIAGNHHFTDVGPVVLVDTRRSRRTYDAVTCITPECGYPSAYGYPSQQSRCGAYMDPYPLSETFFLVSHTPARRGKTYGIYTLDAWGNRARLLGAGPSCFQPMPLRPRPRPAELASVTPPRAAKDGAGQATATLFIQDIYQGMTGIERGRVKYVRVMGALPGPWNQSVISWSLGTDPHRKRIYGIAKVHEDGSAYFTVPAWENLLFHALDENYMALQQMATFVNLMPGENRGCIGCHERRRMAPPLTGARPLAMAGPPQALAAQPGDPSPRRMVDFAGDVQSAMDRHCIRCHSGKKPKGGLDLMGVPKGKFSRSYENLVANDLVSFRMCGSGRAHVEAVPPLTHGSLRSKLIDQIRREPCKSGLTREELIRIATWIDANIPYYGTYRGRRGAGDKDHPHYRALPLVVSSRAK
jgi:hypothetical protein